MLIMLKFTRELGASLMHGGSIALLDRLFRLRLGVYVRPCKDVGTLHSNKSQIFVHQGKLTCTRGLPCPVLGLLARVNASGGFPGTSAFTPTAS